MRFGWYIAAALAAVLAAGCGHAPAPPLRYADAWRCEAPADSLGFEAVRALSPAARERRRASALPWRQLAATTRDDAERLRALVTAVALAPDVPDHGFALAEAAGRVGDTQRALAALDAVEPAIPELPVVARRAARLRLALARGWLHRDRGRWTLAHAWADSAARISPAEREVRMLQGLCRAAHGDLRGAYNISRDIETKEYFRFEWRWIRGVAELARGDVANAYYWLRDTRPEAPWSARFHRDLALVCERVGDPVEARRFFTYSHDALGLGPGTCPGPVDVLVDEGRAEPARVPGLDRLRPPPGGRLALRLGPGGDRQLRDGGRPRRPGRLGRPCRGRARGLHPPRRSPGAVPGAGGACCTRRSAPTSSRWRTWGAS